MISSLVASQMSNSDGSSVWDDDGYLDTSDPSVYPFPLPEWGKGFALEAPVDFSPFIMVSLAILTLLIAVWFLRVQFRPQVERLEKMKYGSVGLPDSGDDAVSSLKVQAENAETVAALKSDAGVVTDAEEPSPATSAFAVSQPKVKKRFTRDKLFTVIISGGVAAALVMTAVLSLFSVLAYGSSNQTEAFGKWATERYPATLVSRDQAETLLTGGEVLVVSAGVSLPVKLTEGYDGLYYLVVSGGDELPRMTFDAEPLPDETVIEDVAPEDEQNEDQGGIIEDDVVDENNTEQPAE